MSTLQFNPSQYPSTLDGLKSFLFDLMSKSAPSDFTEGDATILCSDGVTLSGDEAIQWLKDRVEMLTSEIGYDETVDLIDRAQTEYDLRMDS